MEFALYLALTLLGGAKAVLGLDEPLPQLLETRLFLTVLLLQRGGVLAEGVDFLLEGARVDALRLAFQRFQSA